MPAPISERPSSSSSRPPTNQRSCGVCIPRSTSRASASRVGRLRVLSGSEVCTRWLVIIRQSGVPRSQFGGSDAFLLVQLHHPHPRRVRRRHSSTQRARVEVPSTILSVRCSRAPSPMRTPTCEWSRTAGLLRPVASATRLDPDGRARRRLDIQIGRRVCDEPMIVTTSS